MGTAMASWLVSNVVVNNIPPASLSAAGSVVGGTGRFSITGSGDSFGDALAASVGAVDVAGIAKWRALGGAIRSHIIAQGRANPTSYVANPLGGPVTGAGTLSFASTVFSPSLASVLGLTDALNVAVWLALGTAILGHISANAVVGSLGFTSPSGGGPLVGVSVIT